MPSRSSLPPGSSVPLRAAIVGAGLMGRWHARAAVRLGAEVVGVVDADAAIAARLSARLAAGLAFDDLSTCLGQCEVDVVHVCTPPGTHGPLVHAALERGIHVLVEKPLAPSADETRGILEAARKAGVSVNPVHQFPFQAGVRRILARRAELGDLVRVAFRTSSAGGRGLGAAERNALLTEILPHPCSLFHRLAPGFDPTQFAVSGGQDDLLVVGRHGSTQLEAFITLRGRPPCNELQVTGTRASAEADLFHGFSILDRGSSFGRGKALRPLVFGSRLVLGAATNGVQRVTRLEPAYPGLRALIEAFYASVRANVPPPISDEEIMASAELVDFVVAEGRRRSPSDD
jgi:predicted dehydrogenase